MLGMLKRKAILFFALLLIVNSCGYSSEFTPDLNLKSYVFMNNRFAYASDEARSTAIQNVLKDNEVVCIDFSMLELIDPDLNDIFAGLVAREIQEGDKYELMLLNLTSNQITESGLKDFLKKLQKGEKIGNKKVIPDVRNTVLRIGFPISEEYLQELQRVAPSVFAGFLRLMY